MIEKANPTLIVKDHFATLVVDNENKISKGDVFLFFILPAMIALVLLSINFNLNNDTISLLVTSLSIFAALLFSLLLLIYDIWWKTNGCGTVENRDLRIKYLNQIYKNISFEILISVANVIVLILLSVVVTNDIEGFHWHSLNLIIIVEFLSYYLFGIFILTLLMILKRVHALISTDMKILEKSHQ